MRRWMTAAAYAGSVFLCGCAATIGGGQRFAALQASCGPQTDYGADAQSVYGTLFDAYVAYRHGHLSPAEYCAFANDIAVHYRMRGEGGPDAQRAWADYFNGQRVKALDWRTPVDPTLRGG